MRACVLIVATARMIEIVQEMHFVVTADAARMGALCQTLEHVCISCVAAAQIIGEICVLSWHALQSL